MSKPLSIAVILYSLFNLTIGFIGLDHLFGLYWAMAGLAVFLLFEISFPLIVGAFISCYMHWRWPLALSVVFALASLASIQLASHHGRRIVRTSCVSREYDLDQQ